MIKGNHAKTLLALLLAVLQGCAYVPTTRFEYEPVDSGVMTRSSVRLAVAPLKDDRAPRFMPSLQARAFASYLPILPYVKVPYERIDEHHAAALRERNDSIEVAAEATFPTLISKAIAKDLEGSGLFQEVRFVNSIEDADGADLILGGTLRSTEFDYYFTSYMLGIAGVILWFLPIPMGRNAATVEADLALYDAPESQVWSHRIDGRAGRIFTMYNSSGGSVSSRYRLQIKRYGGNDEGVDPDSLWAYHSAALREAMTPVRGSLSQFLSARPSK